MTLNQEDRNVLEFARDLGHITTHEQNQAGVQRLAERDQPLLERVPKAGQPNRYELTDAGRAAISDCPHTLQEPIYEEGEAIGYRCTACPHITKSPVTPYERL
jgi:hypothetical protein